MALNNILQSQNSECIDSFYSSKVISVIFFQFMKFHYWSQQQFGKWLKGATEAGFDQRRTEKLFIEKSELVAHYVSFLIFFIQLLIPLFLKVFIVNSWLAQIEKNV